MTVGLELAGASPRWRLAGLAMLSWRGWDDEWVVYDQGSGQTHLLNTVSAALLGLIESREYEEGALLELIIDSLPQSDRPVLRKELPVLLGRLQAARLIEAAV